MMVADWINIATGYSANGIFGLYENIGPYNGVKIPEIQRYRQFLFTFDIDWSKTEVKSRFLRIMLNGINIIKVPSLQLRSIQKVILSGIGCIFKLQFVIRN
jgi:hypothetical protein